MSNAEGKQTDEVIMERFRQVQNDAAWMGYGTIVILVGDNQDHSTFEFSRRSLNAFTAIGALDQCMEAVKGSVQDSKGGKKEEP